ncbi:MAG: AAA family ATPase [Clostridia bacterium]|nr:AAA family ATPase [Clostridia bacterium]
MDLEEIKNLINPRKNADREFFLELLDTDVQTEYEKRHVEAVLSMLKIRYLNKLRKKMNDAIAEKHSLGSQIDYTAEKYRRVLELDAEISDLKAKIDSYKPLFEETYFARMDVEDDKEGYNAYYIGKRGDESLEIVDWRAPLARRYYQKSKLSFTINEYDYRVILRRALRTKNGKLLDMQNEYLSVKNYLSEEEIAGREEQVVFDPFLKEILKSRKEKQEVTDIIETIQEKQFEIITLPEDSQCVVQGVAGAGKTMIMLHRLSYLMYNDETLRPENVLVITPSDSFNSFIDELSVILELDKVRTMTLGNYYLKILSGMGIDLEKNIDRGAEIPADYLEYVYSDKFSRDVENAVRKVYDSIYGMVTGSSSREFSGIVENACVRQEEEFDYIKNSSFRVRRCLLGDIKEKKNGGLYYTKPLRYLFNAVHEIREFLHLADTDNKMKDISYFFNNTMSFSKSLRYVQKHSEEICEQAEKDLSALSQTLAREIQQFKRYRYVSSDDEALNREQVELRERIMKEIEVMVDRIRKIKELFASVCDFADVLRGDSYFVSVTKCENVHDIALFFYRMVVSETKTKYGIKSKKLNAADPYIVCLILTKLEYDLTPRYSFLFIDEGQDLAPSEYEVLRKINPNAKFNVFGDLQQNVTPWKFIGNWERLGFNVFDLDTNYRNTNQIVNFVARILGVNMKPIGFDGVEVEYIAEPQIGKFFAKKKGLKALICSAERVPYFAKKSYNVLSETGRISKSKVNVMTVYESKGLEFTAVVVADEDLSVNEKYIAYTRALSDLAVTK